MNKVLVVDDRAEDRRLLRFTLEHRQIRVIEANNGDEALTLLKKETPPPDLVISDAIMPDMDGFSLLRAMKDTPDLAGIPFVFYSATYSSQQEQDLALKLGARAFLTKPIEPAVLWQRLTEALNRGESAQPPAIPPPKQRELLEEYASMVAAKLERKVHELEAITTKWERTFNAMNDILTILDGKMRITQANKAAGDCFGIEPQGLVGKYCHEVFHGEAEQPCPNCPVFLTIQDRKSHMAVITHPKLHKIFHVNSTPVIDEGNELEYIIHVARDITQLKKLENDLFQTQKMDAMGTLAGGIAHDFNNILAAILGYAELTQNKLEVGGRPLAEIKNVIDAALRARELVAQILNFSRKGDSPPLAPLNPAPMVKEALKFLRASLPSTLTLIEDIAPRCGNILADPTKIHQVVVNLCTNAYQAMPDEKGILSVCLHRRVLPQSELALHPRLTSGPYLELTVRDTGMGIPDEVLPHIFEPYFTTKAENKGTGLGLALVYAIVDSLGGMITVDSVVGQGTTFQVYFPALPETGSIAARTAESEPFASPPQAPDTARIMVVDDDTMILTMLATILERLGYQVKPFNSGLDALAAFIAAPDAFDLVITDQTMPGLTGGELTAKVLAVRPRMPIILCTGFSNLLSEEEALALGITRYLTKPIEIRTLSETVRNVLAIQEE